MPLFEVCVESVAGAEAAFIGGAQRVELCANPLEGGTTPSAGTIRRVIEKVPVDCVVLVRSRPGDFLYTEEEFEVIRRDVAMVREAGAFGVAVGILCNDGTVDEERMREIIELASRMQVTFHRAFDMTRDPYEAFDSLLNIGASRILTSGCRKNAIEGLPLIRELVTLAGDQISIMPGGGVRAANISRILEVTEAREIHFTAFSDRDSRMEYRNLEPSLGASDVHNEFEVRFTDPEKVRALVEAAADS